MKLDFRVEQDFGRDEPIKPLELAAKFQVITNKLDILLGTKKNWYEQGCSRKQALQHKIFIDNEISEGVISRWNEKYKREYPTWTAGIWDGGPDDDSAGIDYYPSFSSTGRRKNPLKFVVNFNVELNHNVFNVDSMIEFFISLLSVNENCTNSCVESGGYGFSEIIPKADGYDEVYKKVFPDRVSCGWMLFIPSILLPTLIPEAAKVVPVIKGEKQIGTIVISTEEVFDGNNKEHIARANDIEIRLLDLGLLPLLTEL